MKKLGVIAALLIAIAGGVVSVMQWLGVGPFAPDAGKAGKAAEVVQQEPPKYLDMDPLLIPLLQGDQVVATAQFKVKLETRSAANEANLKRQLPRLADAFLRDLYGYLPRMLKERGKMDLDLVRDRLLAIGARATGDPDLISDLTVEQLN